MVTDAMIQFVRETIEAADPNATQLKKRFPFRKRFEHCFRTYIWAGRIACAGGYEKEIVEVAALLHDIGKPFHQIENHGIAGARIAADYLRRNNFPADFIEKVTFCIENHSRSHEQIEALGNGELKAVRDADLLDESGVLSVLWSAMDEGTMQEQSYGKTFDRIVKWHTESKQDVDGFHTDIGKKLFRQRIAAMDTVIENLRYELGI